MIRNDYGANMPKGFVMARLMFDEDNKQKWFTFYPREFHGLPPYFAKSPAEVMKLWLKTSRDYYKSLGNKLPKEYKIMPTSKVIYLDRY